MKTTVVLFLFFILFFFCNDNKGNELIEYSCKADSIIDMYNDSSFFSNVRCMQYYKGHVYALDIQRKDIAVFTENFDSAFFIGTFGQGPGDLLFPSSFFVYNDTVYIADLFYGIKKFHKTNFVSSFKIKDICDDCRFVYNINKYYIPCLSTEFLFCVIEDKQKIKKDMDVEENDYLFKGRTVKYNTDKQTMIRNQRNILIDSTYLYLVSNNIPVIEKYDLKTNNLLSSFDISNIPVVKRNINFISSKSEEVNSYYRYIESSYIMNGILYLLCAQLGENYNAKTIIRLSLYPEIKVLDMLKLQGSFYQSFCVSEKYIFAFNHDDATIERIKLSDLF